MSGNSRRTAARREHPQRLPAQGHLDDIGIIHMNGRLYDPNISRFMQADPYIQAPENLQSFNRYSYILNNPLNGVDATGEFWWAWAAVAILTARAVGIIDTRTTRTLLAIVASIAIGNPQGALAAAIGKAGAAAVAGFVSGAIQTGTVQGAFQGAASAMLFHGAGALGGPGGFNLPSFSMGRVLLHAAAGCINAVLSGGNCGKGAVTAGLTKALGSALPDATGAGADVMNTVKYAIIGGTMAELGGGKFANGALTGAFQYMMNQAQTLSAVGSNSAGGGGGLRVPGSNTGSSAECEFFQVYCSSASATGIGAPDPEKLMRQLFGLTATVLAPGLPTGEVYYLRAAAPGYYFDLSQKSIILLDQGDIWKIGKTSALTPRYSGTELDFDLAGGVLYKDVVFKGSEGMLLFNEKIRLFSYQAQHLRLPPGNCKEWC